MIARAAVIAIALLASSCGSLLLDATVLVHVQDAHGKPIAGASVLLNANGKDQHDYTTAAGDVDFPIDSDSSFSIAVSAPGFAAFPLTDYRRAGNSRIDITLNLNGGRE